MKKNNSLRERVEANPHLTETEKMEAIALIQKSELSKKSVEETETEILKSFPHFSDNWKAPETPVSEKSKERQFKTVANPLQFWKYDAGSMLTGIFCGTGKQIGTGKDAVKTWLIWDEETKDFILVPQWDGLKKLGEIDEIGIKVIRIIYRGSVADEDGSTKFHLVTLQFADTAAETPVTVEQITEVLASNESEKH